MKMSENSAAYLSDSSVAAINKVDGFDPLKYVRKTDKGAVLDLPYKKLWFRAKHPNGKIYVLIRNLSNQVAAIEARVYFDRRDSEPASNFLISGVNAADQRSVANAQISAIDNALSDAGFGLQFLPADPAESKKQTAAKPAATPTKNRKTVSEISEEKKDAEKPPVSPVEKPAAQKPVQAPPAEAVKAEKAKPAETDSTDPLMAIVNSLEPNDEKAQQKDSEPVEPQPQEIPIAETAVETPAEEEQKEPSPAPSYTKDMTVEDICSMMSPEEAENYVVEGGVCDGWTMATVYERRPKFIDFYINTYEGDNNILRAAAQIVKAARG